MSFKVGDIVRVKDYKDIDCPNFVPSMKCYCGHKYIITEMILYSDCSVYRLNCGADFIFEEECLDKVVASFVPGNKNYTFTFNAKKENKEMRKQERERIENKMEEYIYKSGVCSVNIIVPNRVVEVTFNDDLWTKAKVKTVCDKNDTFSLERALYIAYAKRQYNDVYTSEGIEKKADEFKYAKSYVSKVKNALKVYECQQKLAALDKEEEEIKLRQKQKRHERNERCRARRAEERRNEQLAIQKEAYLQAMMAFEEEKKKLESKKEEEKQTESTKEIVKKVEKLISDAENTTEDTKENKEPEKASVVGENNKEESSENNVKEETTNKMKETESKVE